MQRSTFFALALASVASLLGQTPSASVVGRLVDATGAVIPGVVIKVSNLDTNLSHEGLSNGVGDYTVPYLNPGRYSLEARATGFRAYKHSEFTLEVDQTLRLDIKMQVGAATESVTVTDTPPALNTESGTRGDVTINAEVTEMPLNGRNFNDLAYLTSGVVPMGEGADGQFAVNGARADNVSLMLDGMNNTQRRNTGPMVSPPLEAIQEFKMITSGFSAEYGRFAGGVLSLITKSGTNRFRGSLYEFLRNDALDARNFFDAGKSKLRQNQFGATVSGPVLLPKVYNGRDRTFFIFSWESLRTYGADTQRGVVPKPAMLKGDFSAAVDAFGQPVKITDPLAKAPFPNNQIPAARLDPVAQKIGAFYPAPNVPGNVNNYLVQANNRKGNNKFSTKIDHELGPKDRLSVNAAWGSTVNLNPFQRSPIAIFASTNDTWGFLSGIRYIHSFTPTLLNEAVISFSRTTLIQKSIDSDHDWAADVGFVGATKNPADMGLPFISVSGYIDLGQAYDIPKIWAYNNYQFADSVTWIHGRHALKLGGDFLHYQYFNKYFSNLTGTLTFLGRFTTDPMADFALGYAQTSKRMLDIGRAYLLASNYSAFAQDDFKITPTLTLNIGLRYELMKQPREKYDALSMFVPELGKIVIAGKGGVANFDNLIQQSGMSQYIAMASDVGYPETLVRTNYRNLAPRLGLAWRPFGNARTVIRSGYGIFYGTDSLNRYNGMSQTYPFIVTQSYSASSSNPLLLTLSNAFPASIAKSSGVTSPSGQPTHNPTQYMQTWNLTVEREMGAGFVLEMAYAGSKGTHLPRSYDINQQLLVPSLKVNGVFPRPFPAFSSITQIPDFSNSNYNSGTVMLRRRLSRQFFVRANYVYSKSIDEASNTGGSIPAGFPSAQDSRNLRSERGRSDFDVGHAVSGSFIWVQNFSKHALLRNWQISGTATAYTGPPITPKVANYDVTTGGAARPDRIATGTLADPTPDQWFDRTAFPPVPVGAFHFGSSGRNILDGPGTASLNASLSRRFRFSESRALQFRWESFNLINRANFNLPQTQVDVISGATISAAKAPRQMQLGLRLEF
jgi:Carboxypeptidase regulatory-like domain/TonB-dependent Receptor Plug Domain/TonB dependent receptor